MSKEVKKFKPQMTVKSEIDTKLLGDLRFLLLELRTITPFFGILASEMFIAGPSKSVPTIGVSPRGVVVYNEDFMRGLSPGERVAVFVHEALHVALDYWDRFKQFNNWQISNWAHDFVINDIIKTGMSDLKVVRKQGKEVYDLAVKLPAGGAWSEKYRNMSGEEVYNILYDGIAKRAKEIKEQYLATMADPAAKAAMERQNAINKEMRISVQKGGKLLAEKEDEASSKTKVASTEIEQANDSFMDALRDRDSVSLSYGESQYELEDTAPKFSPPPEKKDEPSQDQSTDQDNAQPSSDGSSEDNENNQDQSQDNQQPGDGNDPGQGNEPGEGQGAEQGADSNDHQSPGQPGQSGESGQPGQSAQAGQGGQPGQPEADGQPSGDSPSDQPQAGQPEGGDLSPYEQAKQDMQGAMKDAFNDYMSKEHERISGDVDGNPNGTTRDQHLDELSKELDDIGDKYVDDVTKAREQGIEEPQEGASQDGQSQPGQDGDDGMDGEGQPGEGQPGEGQPGEGQSNGGSPQPGNGQPGEGQPGSGQPGGQEGPVSEQTARQDVQDTIKDMLEQVSNSLGGKPNGMPGMDSKMASGEDVMGSEGFEQAMRELAEELGSGMDGDVNMDCSDIENNPYAKEKFEDTQERRRQMLTRAIVEDQQNGGAAIGTLPGWFKSEIDKILYPPMSFAQELEKFIGPYGATTQRSFSVRNKRNTFMPNHMIRPGMKKNSAKIYILMDVSGSMMNGKDAENLAHAMGLVEQLAMALRMEVNVIQCDTGVTRVLTTQEAMEEVNNKKFEVHGQGGSDLTPAFEHIWHEMVVEGGNRGNPIICFTDGAIVVPDSVPDGLRQQCLWVTNPGQRPPTTKWGEHRIMENMG